MITCWFFFEISVEVEFTAATQNAICGGIVSGNQSQQYVTLDFVFFNIVDCLQLMA